MSLFSNGVEFEKCEALAHNFNAISKIIKKTNGKIDAENEETIRALLRSNQQASEELTKLFKQDFGIRA
jgi:hypothetical protein